MQITRKKIKKKIVSFLGINFPESRNIINSRIEILDIMTTFSII